MDAIQEEDDPANDGQQDPNTQYPQSNFYQNATGDSGQDDADQVGNTYVGEFQTEYINQEVYNMFERDGMVSRTDLYRCAKAMGGWTTEDGKFENLDAFSGAVDAGIRPEPLGRRERRRVPSDPQVHPAEGQTVNQPAQAAATLEWKYRLDSELGDLPVAERREKEVRGSASEVRCLFPPRRKSGRFSQVSF